MRCGFVVSERTPRKSFHISFSSFTSLAQKLCWMLPSAAGIRIPIRYRNRGRALLRHPERRECLRALGPKCRRRGSYSRGSRAPAGNDDVSLACLSTPLRRRRGRNVCDSWVTVKIPLPWSRLRSFSDMPASRLSSSFSFACVGSEFGTRTGRNVGSAQGR